MRLSRDCVQRRVVIAWSVFAGLAVLWDLSWCFVFRYLQSPGFDHDWRIVWVAYGRADRRFLVGDPFLVVLELVTGLCSFLNFYVAHQLLWGKRQRALIALFAVSTMEIYGTVIYFGSELLTGFANIDTGSFVHTWIMFVGLNSLWLIFPGWCVYELTVGDRSYARDSFAFGGFGRVYTPRPSGLSPIATNARRRSGKPLRGALVKRYN